MSVLRNAFNRDGCRSAVAAAFMFIRFAFGAASRIGGRARRHRPEADTPARRRGRSLAAGVAATMVLFALAAALAGLAAPAQAQTVGTLVSNISQSTSTGASSSRAGQPFTTGSNGLGYVLSSVVVKISQVTPSNDVTDISVQIFETDSSGRPTSALYELSNPSSFNSSPTSTSNNTFTAPTNATLMANTTYAVVVSGSDGTSNVGVRLARTASNAEDSGKAAGWSIANNRFYRDSGSWTSGDNPLMIKINGPVPNATGKPEITGTPQVGQTLTATIGTIMDGDGLPTFPDDFTIQWVSGSTETVVASNSETYVPMPADVGKTLKVKVSYTDTVTDTIIEGPLESDATATVRAAPRPCPSSANWCTTMEVVSFEVGSETQTGLFGSSNEGSIENDTITYGGTTYSIEDLYFVDGPGTSNDQLLLTSDGTQFLARGTALLLGGHTFTLDASSESSPAGTYSWSHPNGSGWIDGEKVTVGVRFPPDTVTISTSTPEAVYGAERIHFNVRRANNTVGPLNVDVVLTDSRGHLPESALSRTITIPDGAAGVGFFIQPDEFKDLNDGAWTVNPGTIKATVVKRAGYKLGSPSSVDVKMHYATTVGFGPFTSSFRVDEGSGSVDVTFYATTGEGMGAPTQRVEVQYSTAAGSATSPGDFSARSGSFFFEPSDFECIAGGYDGCDLARDGHRAMKTVTLPIIREDNVNEGDETFRLVLQRGSNNPKSVVYVDDRGIRGVVCTPGSTCTAKVTIVDNDGITQPTENPDWTLEGSDRTFAGTSSNRPPAISGTESAARCLDAHTPFRLLNHNGNRLTSGIEYSLRQIPGRDVAPYAGLPKPSEMLDLFTIDDKGQIRTVAGKSYLHYTDSLGQLRYTDVIVRALQTSSNRYAEYRLGFNVIHPSRTDKLYLIDCDDDSTKSSQAPLTGQVQAAPDSHDGATAFSFRILFSEEVDIEPDELRDDAIKVSHATVTAAARVDGRDDLWELTLTPKATQAISIQLRGQLECTEDGAICTADGKKLAANVIHSVAYAAPGTRSTPNPSALTASFENAPASHDGTSMFTVQLAFSEAVFDGTESFDRNARVRSAVSVTGGTLRGGRRVDPDAYDRWILRIEPDGNGDVTVTLPATTGGCSATNAICTPGGAPLSAEATAMIEGPGATEAPEPATLTAAFENVPSSHDGSNGFTLELAFSAAVFDGTESFDKNARVRSAVSIAGGTLTNFRRTNPAVYDRWTLRIRPSGHGDVTVSIPPTNGGCSASGAICTPGGTPLSGSTTATIQGPATLSVADATVEEGPDAELAFVITLSRAVSQAVTVDFATSDGSAEAGADYTAKSETVTFAAGATSKTVNVAVIDDAVNEGNEAMTATLSNPSGAVIADGTATGTIQNTDPMPQAWLARFGREAAGHVADAIAGRLRGAPGSRVVFGSQDLASGEGFLLRGKTLDAGSPGDDFLPGGKDPDGGLLTATPHISLDERTGEELERPWRELSMPELLLASSFHLASSQNMERDSRWALWGRATRSSFEGAENALTLSGEVTTATLGVDHERGRWLVGVALARSAGEGSFRAGGTCEAGCAGEVESTLTGVYPYARYHVSERFSLWGAIGHGRGDLRLSPEGMASIETDVEMSMAAGGARGVVLPASVSGGFELALRADLLVTSTGSDAAAGLDETEAETSRIRLLLEGSRSFKMGAEGDLTTSLELGLRNDGGDAETGSGVELGGGVRYASGGLSLEFRARGLLAHSESDYEEWGVSGSVLYTQDSDGRGLSMRLGSAWGAESGGAERLWAQAQSGLSAGSFDPEARLDAELSYGFDAPRGLLTPYTGVALTGGGETWRAGARWKLGPSSEVSLEGSLRDEASAEKPEGGVLLRGSKRW